MASDSMAGTGQPGGVSRRKAMLTGAGLVVAGTVAGAGGVIATQLLADDGAAGAKANPKLPVMVYLRDAATGELDLFVANRRKTLIDKGFAAKLVQAADEA